jgi:hypothetical protein
MLRVQIVNMERDSNTDTVLRVQYSLDLIETVGEVRYESSIVGKVDLPAPPASPIPFSALTEVGVQGWVITALGAVYLAETEVELQIKNNAKKAPQTINELPWSGE